MPADNRHVDFADIRQRADFRAVLAHYGLVPIGTKDQAKIRYPFHDDHDPSCSVNLARGVFNCHACPAEGNLLDFVHRMETRDGSSVSFRQVGLLLAEICGLELSATGSPEGARKPQDGPHHPRAQEGPSTLDHAYERNGLLS